MAGYNPAAVAAAAQYLGTSNPDQGTQPADAFKDGYQKGLGKSIGSNFGPYSGKTVEKTVCFDAPCELEQVTLSRTVRYIVHQTNYLTNLVMDIELVLFDREYATRIAESQGNDISVFTVEQNASSVLSKLYDLSTILGNIKHNLGDR